MEIFFEEFRYVLFGFSIIFSLHFEQSDVGKKLLGLIVDNK